MANQSFRILPEKPEDRQLVDLVAERLTAALTSHGNDHGPLHAAVALFNALAAVLEALPEEIRTHSSQQMIIALAGIGGGEVKLFTVDAPGQTGQVH